MTLTGSGQISFNDIRVELNVPSQSPFTLGEASRNIYAVVQNCQTPFPSSTNPDAITEWYGYDHSATASLAYNFTTEYSPTSCAVACDLLDGEDEETLVAYTRNNTFYFGDATCTAEVSPVGYYAVDRTTCYTVTANSITTSACGSTTTTTTTTPTVAGTCYRVENTSGVNTPTLLWTSIDGGSRSGTASISTTYNICSIVTPTEQGGALDLSITSCSPPDACTNNCTTITCKGCAYTC